MRRVLPGGRNAASGSVIVMGNATFHKRQDSVEALRRDGKIPEYLLPTYSPDLNPVEHKWAQAKALRRRLQCPVDVLFTDPLL
jgi:transposase